MPWIQASICAGKPSDPRVRGSRCLLFSGRSLTNADKHLHISMAKFLGDGDNWNWHPERGLAIRRGELRSMFQRTTRKSSDWSFERGVGNREHSRPSCKAHRLGRIARGLASVFVPYARAGRKKGHAVFESALSAREGGERRRKNPRAPLSIPREKRAYHHGISAPFARRRMPR